MKTKICYECRKKFYCDENNTCSNGEYNYCYCPKCFKQKYSYNVNPICLIEKDNDDWII